MNNIKRVPWKTIEWKQRRLEILSIRDKCESCGLSDNESKEKYKKGLNIHHKERYLLGIQLKSYISCLIFQYLNFDEWPKIRMMAKGNGTFTEYWKSFLREHEKEIDDLYTLISNRTFNRYTELRDDDIIVLCPDCHYKIKLLMT